MNERGRRFRRPLLFAGFLQRAAFIGRSSNKLYGTGETAEHRRSPFVVGRAMQTP
jgi:hypothetical protein